jgi:hypothetical protein
VAILSISFFPPKLLIILLADLFIIVGGSNKAVTGLSGSL